MKKVIIVCSVISLVFCLIQFCSAESIMVCASKKVALFDPKAPKDVSVEVAKDSSVTIFAGLNTDTPKIKGNMGESELRVIQRTNEAIWMIEAPQLGGINIWTIFIKKKMFTCSKQYPLISSGNPLGVMFMGYCD